MSTETTDTLPEESAPTAPAIEGARASPQKPRVSIASALRRFMCRSKIMVPFMMERAAKELVALPPPIHVFYREMEEARRPPNQSPHLLATHSENKLEAQNSDSSAEAGRGGNGDPNQLHCDVFNFNWTRNEINAMRRQQRCHLYKQRQSPHAPVQVMMSQLMSRVLSDTDGAHVEESISTSADAAAPTAKRCVLDVLGGLCTRGIPQVEYIRSVFHYRMGVLQKCIDAIPTGVVVPDVVQATVRLDELSDKRSSENTPIPTKTEIISKRALLSTTAPTVTFPHPRRPFTYQDLAQNPLLLTSEQRADRRAALLHKRTLSEEIYGQPAAYL
ncbi:hypothetical protein JKF63_03903 [Porcisia hertigi]|uniref:Uncharacterized protein n=1 Tax=Porcisia hertigi TaxID=2761500 RepID=A0A836ILZ3_9TRYP|nr:hypothetical protein JKF63_03903 [Porcisia hertigi]